MAIEQTASLLGKKSRYIYSIIHNRRMGTYLNEQQKTALKYVSELAQSLVRAVLPEKYYHRRWGVKS